MFLIFIGEGDSEDGIRSNRFVTGVSSPGVELGGGICAPSSTIESSRGLGKGGLGVEWPSSRLLLPNGSTSEFTKNGFCESSGEV